ncbi:MAG TPA: ribosome recycling factor [Myxococcales bacterium LLY-WYZ-16_1]|jgi:ribosome recycling factor|nr:ribosome recycling factor [Myxococcales bacterium LLY-WYZ-16_1]
MNEEVLEELNLKAEQSMDALRTALTRIRTGRANLSMLDTVRVEYYGTKVPLNQVANLAVADPRLITVKPFDRSSIGDIEKALRNASDLGITPQNDGEKILLPIPALTEERRREFTKIAKSKGEEAKISIRNARRDANETAKKLEKDGDLPEDDAKRLLEQVQKVTDDYVKSVDELVAKKEKEIMEV